MSGIKNSKKNDAGKLLPQRRPRLGKYIALAVMLHVVFGIVYLYVTQREAKKPSEVTAPPVKVVPLSPQNKPLRRTQIESPSVPSFRSASRPMTPSKLMSLPNDDSAIPPLDRLDSPPLDRFIPSTKPNLRPAPTPRGDFSNRMAGWEVKAWPDKWMAFQDMHVALLSQPDVVPPASEKPVQLSEPLLVSDLKKPTGQQQPVQSPVKPKPDRTVVEPVRSPASQPEVYLPEKRQSMPIRRPKLLLQMDQMLPSRHRMSRTNDRPPEAQFLASLPKKLAAFKFMSPQQPKVLLPIKTYTAVPEKPTLQNIAVQMPDPSPTRSDGTDSTAAQTRVNPADVQMLALQAEIGPLAPAQHRPVSRPQTRLGYADDILQPMIVSKQSKASQRDWNEAKKPPRAASPLVPEELIADLGNRKSAKWLQPGKLQAINHQAALSHTMGTGAVRIETVKKTTHLRPKTVWQATPEISPQLANYTPLQPELPPSIEDHLADMVNRLLQPTLQTHSVSKVRLLAKNLTYRDLGLESEGTKILSGLLKAQIKKQDGVELLGPADVSRNPQIVIEGQMWDDSQKINLHLWSLDHQSGHRINIANLSFHRQMLPDSVKIQPPSGKNLNLIQRVVELMKQNFPQGGDFQLGVWPDKGVDAIYHEDENLIVSILPEKNAYLHIDYYQIDGKVVHLLSNQDKGNYVKAGKPYIIGDPISGGRKFKVSEPFGEELLVVVASQNPLDTITHGETEPAEPYVKRLAQSLKMQRETVLMAGSHYIILTKKKEPKK